MYQTLEITYHDETQYPFTVAKSQWWCGDPDLRKLVTDISVEPSNKRITTFVKDFIDAIFLSEYSPVPFFHVSQFDVNLRNYAVNAISEARENGLYSGYYCSSEKILVAISLRMQTILDNSDYFPLVNDLGMTTESTNLKNFWLVRIEQLSDGGESVLVKSEIVLSKTATPSAFQLANYVSGRRKSRLISPMQKLNDAYQGFIRATKRVDMPSVARFWTFLVSPDVASFSPSAHTQRCVTCNGTLLRSRKRPRCMNEACMHEHVACQGSELACEIRKAPFVVDLLISLAYTAMSRSPEKTLRPFLAYMYRGVANRTLHRDERQDFRRIRYDLGKLPPISRLLEVPAARMDDYRIILMLIFPILYS